MGNMGVDGHRDFTVIGNVVNVAFRLESLTSKANLDLLIGEDAARMLAGIDQNFIQKRYQIRGKEEQLLTYGCSFEDLRKYLATISPGNVT